MEMAKQKRAAAARAAHPVAARDLGHPAAQNMFKLDPRVVYKQASN